ncbi:DUF692 domain-containing protein [Kribbella sp. VKM Ac-2571]|uniref:DUF692 domain-containing protein n=1 Tax=Kribbella sp. VKM Ac-2571 TaxID=2512222 RepID=UPI00192D8296|nr:DUF692 domain-containing protein [Kribbella sp. VKM Ac-2571]
MRRQLDGLPALGVGLGYRRELAEQITANKQHIDWLEIITDDFIDDPQGFASLADLAANFPVVTHGVDMSIGSTDPLDMAYVERVAAVAAEVDAPWVSDHLCFTAEAGVDLGTLTPVHRTRDRAKAIGRKAQQVQDRLGRPFLLENITYYVDLPGTMTEAQFITEVLDHCDAGLLLDLENVVINSVNHQFDAWEFVDALPLQRVVQVHVAGEGRDSQGAGMRIDSHDGRVSAECLRLLTHLVDRASVRAAMVERDSSFPEDFTEILDDLNRVRAAFHGRTANASG